MSALTITLFLLCQEYRAAFLTFSDPAREARAARLINHELGRVRGSVVPVCEPWWYDVK